MQWIFSLLLLVACQGGDPEQGTLDVRVEHTEQESAAEASGPRACLGDGERVYAVWADDRGGTSVVRANVSADGGLTWADADTALADGDGASLAVDLACSGQDVWAVWEDTRDGELDNHNVYLDHSADGGVTWASADVNLDGDTDGADMSLGPRVVAAGGSVYVAWFDNRDGAYDIYLQSSQDGGATWLAEPTRVDTDEAGEAYSAWPRVAADGTGNVVVVWEDSRSGASDIYANASTDHGATFGAADVRLDGGDDAGAADSFLPSVALADGHVYVAWHDARYGASDVLLNVSADAGAGWASEAVRVSSQLEGENQAMNPVVAAVGERVHVAFQDDRSGGYDVYLRTSTDHGASWAAAETRLDTDAAGSAQSYDPVIALRGQDVFVAWLDRRDDVGAVGFDDLLYSYSLDAGATWAAEDLRVNSNAPGSAWASDPTALLLGDEFTMVWADGRFGSGDVFAARRTVGEESVYVAPEEPEP